MGRQVSKKVELTSDAITTVYRALRKGETPRKFRQVIPDTNDSTSCHGICSFCLSCSTFRIFRRQASATYQHRVRPHLMIYTTLKVHFDICCMSHPMGYLSNYWNLYFPAVNCVMQHPLVVHGQSQWLIMSGRRRNCRFQFRR